MTSGGDYYSFGEQLKGIMIHELWDYIHDKMENNFEELISEFQVKILKPAVVMYTFLVSCILCYLSLNE